MDAALFFRVALVAVFSLLTGCASVKSAPGNEPTEWLTPSNAFHMSALPFFRADIAYGTRIPVVGTTERGGRTYRVVALPAPAAYALRHLINDDGSFEGSAINTGGSMMGFSYSVEPSGTKLVALGDQRPSHSYDGIACDSVVPATRRECEDAHRLAGLDAYGRLPGAAAALSPIDRLALCIGTADRTLLPMVAESMLSGLGAGQTQLAEGRARIIECTDTNVKAAVTAAGDASDLREAVKVLYVKERAWADSLLPNGSQSKITYREDVSRATSELDQAVSKVTLERKLAPSQ